MKGVFRNGVIMLALMAIGAFTAWLYLRPEIPRGSELSDGETAVSTRRLRDELRLALWQEPEVLSRDLASDLTETDPSFDPSTGHFYFVLGEPGLDQDLWVAAPENGGFSFHRLDELNTTYNESAPVFHQGYLFFATNRPGGHGGLDLVRSRATDRGFLPPENLGHAINTSADETDPEFRPGTHELYFASNRDSVVGVADFDLHVAVTDGDRFSDSAEVQHSTPYDERSPTFAAGGRLLLFCSNRPDGEGGFDLYRMLQSEDEWREPENLDTLNTAADEFAPNLADGGFTLYFSSDRAADAGHPEHDIFVAKTRELFPVSGRGLSLLDLTILFMLALVALLAFLARRWSALDIIYKCLLASILLHLLLLWLSRRVEIESEEMQLPGGSDTYEVQLLTNLLDAAQRLEDQEHGEDVPAPAPTSTTQVARAAAAPTHVTTPTKQAAELMRAEVPTTEAPAATPTQASPQFTDARSHQTPVPTLAEAYERIQGSVPEMSVRGDAVETPDTTAEPQTERSSTAATPTARPGVAPATGPSLARAERAASSAAPTSIQPVARAPAAAPASPNPSRTTMPTDRVARGVHEGKPEMDVTAHATSSSAQREVSAQPARSAAATSHSAQPEVRPAEAVLVRVDGTRAQSVPSPARESHAGSPALAAADPSAFPTAVPQDRIEAGSPAAATAAAAEMSLAPAAATGLAQRSDTANPTRHTPGSAIPPAVAPTAGGPLVRAERAERPPAGAPSTALAERSMESADPDAVTHAIPDDRVVRQGAPVASAVGVPSDDLAPAATSRPRTSTGDLAPAPRPARSERGSPAVQPREQVGALSRSPSRQQASPTRLQPLSRPGVDQPARPTPARIVEADLPRTGRENTGQELAVADSLAGTPRSFGRQRPGGRAPGPSRARFVLADPGVTPPTAAPLKMPELPAERDTEGPSREPTLFERRSGTAKKTALQRGGGSKETEQAVIAGLRYLARVQRRDGSFGDLGDGSERQKYIDVRMGKTGLAALAFLGAGHTPTSDSEFSEHVTRTLAWMLSEQDPKSGHFGDNAGYGHGIATYAVAESYAMTRDRRYLPYLMRAVRHILDHQVLSASDRKLVGGWRYYYPEGQKGPDPYPRTSLSSWQVMALESARAGGVPVPEEALDASADYFRGCFDRQYGYFRYNHNPEWLDNSNGYRTLPASTPAAMFVLSLLGADSDGMMSTAAEYVMDRLPSGYRYRGNDAFARQATGNLYFWYYGSLAMFLRGGQDWRRWNEAMKATLLPAQNRDGSWTEISAYGRDYAGDDARERSYTTAISVLTLEVYYRYFTPQLMRQGR